jgi:arabinofuranan 3-O-arabinosyltransferase
MVRGVASLEMLRRRAALPAALLVGAGALLLALLFAARISHKMPDLAVYWTAAARARAAEPLYRASDGHYQFKYLPAFAVLTAPGASVSLQTAKAVWFAASVVLLVALVSLSLAILPERRKAGWVLVTLTLVVMLKFYSHELVLGQMNVLFAVVVASAVVALRGGREAAAGALIALAIVVKPYAVIFLPWLVARRRAGAIASAAIGTVALLALPALVYGAHGDIELHRAWWKTVTDSTAPNLTNADNVSIAAMWAKWLGAGLAATVLTAVTSAIVLGSAVVVFARRRTVSFPEGLEAALLLTCIPLLSPQGWDYVFLVSTPAIVFLVNYEDRLPAFIRFATIAALATIGLTVYDLMGRAAYTTFMALSILSVCYVVVIGALCRLRARGIA